MYNINIYSYIYIYSNMYVYIYMGVSMLVAYRSFLKVNLVFPGGPSMKIIRKTAGNKNVAMFHLPIMSGLPVNNVFFGGCHLW